jgi:hypothetical protein
VTAMEILYLTEGEVKQCITMQEAVVLSDKGIQADALGRVVGDKFYMHTGNRGFIKPFSGYLEGEVILYIALGIWGEYAAILPHVYRRAKELGLGRRL